MRLVKRSYRSSAGLTFVELLLAMTIMSFIALALASVSAGTGATALYNSQRGLAVQHGRVSFERINRMVQESTSAENHPGAVVVYDSIGTYRFPDTLLVWHPSNGAPVNAAGPPLMNEVLVYSFNPSAPNELVEMWNPVNTTPIPFNAASLNTTDWRSTIAAYKSNASTQKTVLSNLLRVANPTGQSTRRGAVRFESVVNPTTTDLANYRAGTTAWKSLPWPTVFYGSSFGLRQLRVRTELQLVTDDVKGTVDNLGLETLPLFGSTSTYQRLSP